MLGGEALRSDSHACFAAARGVASEEVKERQGDGSLDQDSVNDPAIFHSFCRSQEVKWNNNLLFTSQTSEIQCRIELKTMEHCSLHLWLCGGKHSKFEAEDGAGGKRKNPECSSQLTAAPLDLQSGGGGGGSIYSIYTPQTNQNGVLGIDL
jgi:hypothetical protein